MLVNNLSSINPLTVRSEHHDGIVPEAAVFELLRDVADQLVHQVHHGQVAIVY